MPNNSNKTDNDKCIVAAQRTIDLVDNREVPDRITDAVLHSLIEMSEESADSQIRIWHEKTGLSLGSLAALYALYEKGKGYRRVRLYGWYEASRLKREGEKQNNEQS
jgi:hypothetical protein